MVAEHSQKDARIELRDLLDKYFDLNELRSLIFDLGINYGNIAGETKRNKFEYLISILGRENRLQEFIDLASAARPHVNWPDLKWDSYDWVQPFPSATLTSPYKKKPKENFEPDLVFVPAGPFMMGSDTHEPEESPQHEVNLSAYRISRNPITNEQFSAYIWKLKLVATSAMRWEGNTPHSGQNQSPVTGVTWNEALNYCNWLSNMTNRSYGIPSEAQWEKAARGIDGSVVPSGFLDSVGDIREWTSSLWGHSYNEPDPKFSYPWLDDLRNDIDQPSTKLRVYRGGWNKDMTAIRCSVRAGFDPAKPGPRRSRHGFRVVLRSFS